MAELKPLKSPSNRKQNIFVHKDLKSCSHVFLRIDRVKKALEPPYEGPYTVQKNRLKPAYLLAVDNQNEPTSVGQKNEISNWKELSPMPDEQSTTSCGRKIKKPDIMPSRLAVHRVLIAPRDSILQNVETVIQCSTWPLHHWRSPRGIRTHRFFISREIYCIGQLRLYGAEDCDVMLQWTVVLDLEFDDGRRDC
ncbi:retrovirus-related Pol polyprotein from transposon opus [Trichonephila clavipes]|nr:retrovirus-related Pol polyprotein from transposon opus [Trichonephila clavipes]